VGATIDRAKDAAGAVMDQAQETAEYAADRMQAAARTAGDTAGDVGSTFVEMIRRNPVPAALAGASLAWLWINRPGPAGPMTAPYPFEGSRRQRDSMMYRAQETAGQVVDQTQGAVAQVANQAQETVGQVANQAQQTVGQLTSQAQETVGQFTNQAQYQALRARYGWEQMVRDNPLVVGLAAAALGALAGLPVPQTTQENRLMGRARDTLMERAQEAAQETFDKVQHVAEGVRETAQEEARNQGLVQ
jgi:hypothetical protein